ncbi:MAG: zf-HC2 domain-containing protein [Acidobacteria bacterium]|nr:zf-HC2 domain-containing protein [Acidobacteriota bacterium]
MNCQQTRDLLKAFLEGELDRNSMLQVRRHLATCRECACSLNREDLMEILPVLDDSVDPSEDFSDRFYAALEKGRNRNLSKEGSPDFGMKRPWLPRWSWGLAAAAALAVFVSAGLYLRQSPLSGPEVAEVFYDFEVTENLPILMDMALISNLELFEDMETIENLPQLN